MGYLQSGLNGAFDDLTTLKTHPGPNPGLSDFFLQFLQRIGHDKK